MIIKLRRRRTHDGGGVDGACIESERTIRIRNKAGYTATPVACRWAGAVLEKVTRAFGQEPKR